jgi:hypothetical protein
MAWLQQEISLFLAISFGVAFLLVKYAFGRVLEKKFILSAGESTFVRIVACSDEKDSFDNLLYKRERED